MESSAAAVAVLCVPSTQHNSTSHGASRAREWILTPNIERSLTVETLIQILGWVAAVVVVVVIRLVAGAIFHQLTK